MTKEVYTANVLDTLKGVIVDWATAQIEGLKAEVGNERAE